jgi:hypothetical protein
MMLGLSLSAFTILHVVISFAAIAAGVVVLIGLLSSRRNAGWTALFLATTVLTSVTGFMFPFTQLLPSHIFGAVSLVLLAAAIAALYVFRLAGPWRWLYVVTAMIALYLNVFVLVVQAFQKVPALEALAPNGSEPPFAVAQAIVLVAFVGLTIAAARRFRPLPRLSS